MKINSLRRIIYAIIIILIIWELYIIGKVSRYEYILVPQNRQMDPTETNFYKIDKLTGRYCIANSAFSISHDRLRCPFKL